MWFYAVLWLVSAAITYALRPKPQPPELGTLQAPTAEEGRVIPVLFGSRWLNQPNIVWYGDVSTSPVRKKGGKKG